MDKVKFSNILRKSNSKTQKGIPLVVTYHPLLKLLSGIFNSNIYLLHVDQENRGYLLHNPRFFTKVRIS